MREAGVLGINRRNLEYVFAHNPREHFASVDDKVAAKELLDEAGLPTPETLAVVRTRADIDPALTLLRSRNTFVVKPSSGFGGSGILLVRRDEANSAVDEEALRFHLASILSGMYSMKRLTDSALIEERLVESEVFRRLHGGTGVSDVRIVVVEAAPAMAMLRLPCRSSRGVANLHAGGVGVGIDLATGVTTFAIRKGKPVEKHPDSGVPLAGVAIPHWERILELSRVVNGLFQMGYLGVDVVVDERHGPVIVEVNARPGLAIQIANRRGLLEALKQRQGAAGGRGAPS